MGGEMIAYIFSQSFNGDIMSDVTFTVGKFNYTFRHARGRVLIANLIAKPLLVAKLVPIVAISYRIIFLVCKLTGIPFIS